MAVLGHVPSEEGARGGSHCCTTAELAVGSYGSLATPGRDEMLKMDSHVSGIDKKPKKDG